MLYLHFLPCLIDRLILQSNEQDSNKICELSKVNKILNGHNLSQLFANTIKKYVSIGQRITNGMSLFSLLHVCYLVLFDINAVVLLLLLCVSVFLFYTQIISHFTSTLPTLFPALSNFSFTLVNMLLSAKQNYSKKILVSLCCSF